MNNNLHRNTDWLTNGLVILACIVLILIGMKFSKNKIEIPKHADIQSWDTLATSTSPYEGDSLSAVKIVEIYSYGCGFCRILHHSLSKLRNMYPKEVTIYYKPVHMGNFGFDYVTAVAVHCANLQDAFSNTHQLLFQYDGLLPNWENLAQKASIPNSDQFIDCINNRRTSSLVYRDEIISDSLDVRGVPYIVINGKGYLGSLNYSQLETIIQSELE